MQTMISLNPDDYPKYETHRVTMNDIRKMYGLKDVITEYDPLHNEYIFYTIQEMNRVPNPRFEKPCENCGANDWRPIFKRVYARKGHKLTHYICEYCGTRRNEYELHPM